MAGSRGSLAIAQPSPLGAPLAFGVSWDFCVRILLVAAIGLSAAAPTARLVQGIADRISVIVRESGPPSAAPERAVRHLGGTVNFQLPLIDGFCRNASRPTRWARSRPRPGSKRSRPTARSTSTWPATATTRGTNMGSLYNTAKAIGATQLWSQGITGEGIDVAVIDTGVTPSSDFAGRLVNGPDLSFDSQRVPTRYVDGYGHGTHMASIIAARDSRLPAGASLNNDDYFVGMAPDARIVNMKVGAANGVTDVSQVIAAVDWVVQHRNKDGLNIRVLNLSFGTDGKQDYTLDPLTYAVERAWFAGIVVVASAGNEGYGTEKLDNPAYDPFVIAVGASDCKGTITASDDEVPDFSNRGTSARRPDLVAPGKSVIGLRVAGLVPRRQVPRGSRGRPLLQGQRHLTVHGSCRRRGGAAPERQALAEQ